MGKRLLCLLLLSLIFLFSSLDVSAFSNYKASDLEICSRLTADSNSFGGFVYGSDGKTLYSSMLIPSHYNRYVNAPYNIKSICQSGELSCAMYICDNKTSRYGITTMNMNSGVVSDYTFEGVNDASSKMFSLSGNYAYFVRADATYSYVAIYGLDGKFKRKCSFNDNIYMLFNNNSITYSMLYDGRIYRFSGTGYTQVANIGKGVNAFNAGIDYICTESGMLVSLANGTTLSVSKTNQNCIVAADSGIYTADNYRLVFKRNNASERFIELSNAIKCVVAYKDRVATLNNAYNYNDISNSELKSNAEPYNKPNGQNGNLNSDTKISDRYRVKNGKYIVGVAPSTSVTEFKKNFSDSDAIIYNSDGNTVSSGKIKTGYTVNVGNNSYIIIVSGDLTCEGNVKSNDTNLLMNYLVGAVSLNDIQMMSADYDFNGVIDNRDLVLIARHTE